MRQIKFRGKDIDNGEWVYGYFVNDPEWAYIVEFTDEKTYQDDYERHYEVDPETVGQFTGLQDKNGTDIYEGDILGFTDKWEWYIRDYRQKVFFGQMTKEEVAKEIEGKPIYKRPVEWPSDNDWLSGEDIKRYWEVIGNIHKNPELLYHPDYND